MATVDPKIAMRHSFRGPRGAQWCHCLACRGRLSRSDLEHMYAMLRERFAVARKPGLVHDLVDFEG